MCIVVFRVHKMERFAPRVAGPVPPPDDDRPDREWRKAFTESLAGILCLEWPKRASPAKRGPPTLDASYEKALYEWVSITAERASRGIV